jgi:hypothetical protein
MGYSAYYDIGIETFINTHLVVDEILSLLSKCNLGPEIF